MTYQKSITATDTIRQADYRITIYGKEQHTTDSGHDIQAHVTLELDSGAINHYIRLTPDQARALAANIALASIAAETPEPELIDFDLAPSDEVAA